MRNILKDPEFWAILLFNLFLLGAFYVDATSGKTVILLYYVQSVLIGVQSFIRMFISGVRFGKGLSYVERFGSSLFFAFHYGFFHLVYLVFLVSIISNMSGSIGAQTLLGFLVFMVVNTLLSTLSDLKKDGESGNKPLAFMFQPYLRILPMHLFIILGFNMEGEAFLNAFVIFLVLKTIADLLMHIIVNQTYRKKRHKALEGWI